MFRLCDNVVVFLQQIDFHVKRETHAHVRDLRYVSAKLHAAK